MKNSSFSAPGSVILAGEYGMLFGKPALASAVNLHTTINCSSKIKGRLLDGISQLIVIEAKKYLKKHNLFIDQEEYFFQITSEIPDSETFGYIDAKVVALTAQTVKIFSKKSFTNEEIHTIAYQTEKKLNKKELGIHCTASFFGGLIYYRKEFEFLKNISALNMKFPDVIERRLFFVDTGESEESIQDLENFVSNGYNSNTKKIESIFQEMEKTVKRLVVSIAKEDYRFFQECIKQAEQLLEDLDIVSAFTKKVIRDIDQFGRAKVVGKGGRKNRSGYLLVCSEDERRLKEIINRYKLSYFKFNQSQKGLTQKINEKNHTS
ncbi:hypothetical protein HY041_01065 [Candidatus Roizmanbacteria bacterium]|nr:hypothetical protein [Candidatus Roizmanbacteria bacterium]